MSPNPQPFSQKTEVMRIDIQILVELDDQGRFAGTSFSAMATEAKFLLPPHFSLLVFTLETQFQGNPDRVVDEPARFATHPLQWKDKSGGRPIPEPACFRLQRDNDFRCTLSTVNTASVEESFGFHGVFVLGKELIGTPDPTVVLTPPTCTPPNCPTGPG